MRGEALDGLHDGGMGGEGAGAEVVAVGEAAGDEDGVRGLEVGGGVPEESGFFTEDRGDDIEGVVVAVGAGEDEDAEFHEFRVLRETRGSRRMQHGQGCEHQ